jgi:hopanoid-associated phosphorylase
VSAGRNAALPVIAVTGLAIEARIAAGAGVRAIAGGGVAPRLAAALEREIEQGAGAVISFGIAGGLAPDVAPGRWIVARAVVTPTENWLCDPEWTRILAERLHGSLTSDIAGVDAPVIEAARKGALYLASGAAALDTESHIAARIAAEHGLPFAAFRVVADPAHRNLPPVATQSLDADGTIDVSVVLRSLARRPGQLPLLLRTAVDARTAFRALSRGRRLLGPRLGHPDFDQLLFDVP